MSTGRFGSFGGQYIPETLMNEIQRLEKAYDHYKHDPAFQAELKELRLKAKDLRKKIEDKQKDEIFSALIASGKTVEEVMKYLKSGNEEKAE